MKKILIAVILTLGAVGALSAESKGITLYVAPDAYAVLGSANGFRGFAGGVDVKLDLFHIVAPGLQALVEYDSYFKAGNVPLLFTLSLFGTNFWLGIGSSLPLGTLQVGGLDYAYGAFPNTYALGFGIPLIPIGDKSHLKLAAQLSYTQTGTKNANNAFEQAAGDFIGVLMGIRAYAGVQLELGL